MGGMVTNYEPNGGTYFTDQRTKLTYFGTQGGVFHLAGWGMKREGVSLGTDPKHLYMPPMESLWTEGARMDGAWYNGTVISKREMDVEFQIESTTRHGFRLRNDWWWSNWSTSKDGVLAAHNEATGWRWLDVRLAGPAEPKQGKDPALIKACDYDVTIVAPEALWRSFKDKSTWVDDGTHVGTIRNTNWSDIDAFPSYTMPGPGKYFIQDGENGEIINLPELGWGETMKVDTHPLRPFIRVWSAANGSDGKLRWAKMKGKRLRTPVPANSAARIRVGVTAGAYNAQIQSTVTPRFLSPW
jgi:hypothetical protein